MLKTSVERNGSPLVMTHTMSKTRKASIDRMTMHTMRTGRKRGSVTFQKIIHGPAPSIIAASRGAEGSDWRPAKRMMVNHGVQSQMSVIITIAMLVQRYRNQTTGSKPSACQTTFTMPNWSLNIQVTMMAATTGAIINGSRMI